MTDYFARGRSEPVLRVPDPNSTPDDPARVVVRAEWRGLVHQCEKSIEPEVATHYAVDKAVWDAHIQVRRRLVEQEYPGTSQDSPLFRAGIRNEVEAFGAIRAYLTQNTEIRFELVPPEPRYGRTQWFAYFSSTGGILNPDRLITNPPVGVGSTDYIAIENLLRFTEGREPIDG